MPSIINTRPEGRVPRSHPLFSLASVLLLALLVASAVGALAPTARRTAARAAGSFTFTAAGDYAQTRYTSANLTFMKTSGAAFNLALGDFSYTSPVTGSVADAWSSYASGNVGASFPFEIIPGEHDASALSNYAADLPDRLGSSGPYAQQYFFDYPAITPLARFIMIAPGQIPGYYYSKGSAGYRWVSSTIDSARAAGIRWVIVGMYNDCFSLGSQHCSKDDLLNLLVSKKVDLVLHAHKHDYQASKQLAFNGTTCTSLTTASYNAACVVNATQSMVRGQGTVIVITGTGGATPQLSINPSDPALQYFRASNGAGTNATWGVTQITISPTQLTDRFVPVKGVKGSGTFTDTFTITGS
jgi:hypothetical protein